MKFIGKLAFVLATWPFIIAGGIIGWVWFWLTCGNELTLEKVREWVKK